MKVLFRIRLSQENGPVVEKNVLAADLATAISKVQASVSGTTVIEGTWRLGQVDIE